jgi:hypothetical protein
MLRQRLGRDFIAAPSASGIELITEHRIPTPLLGGTVMWGRSISLAVLLPGLLLAQDSDKPFAPGDSFSISHTPINAKLVPVDCDARKVPIHSYRHSANEATFLIPEDSPTCTYEVLGTRIRVVRRQEKQTAEVKPVKPSPPAAK